MNFFILIGINLFEWMAHQTVSPDLAPAQKAELARLRAENQTLQTRLNGVKEA